MDKTQKKIFYIVLLAFVIGLLMVNLMPKGNCQTMTIKERSINPHSKDFYIYYNDKLSISSLESTALDRSCIDKNALYSTETRAYFVLTEKYYKIFFQEENILFTVYSNSNPLGEHLCQLITIMKMYKAQQNLIYAKNTQKL